MNIIGLTLTSSKPGIYIALTNRGQNIQADWFNDWEPKPHTTRNYPRSMEQNVKDSSEARFLSDLSFISEDIGQDWAKAFRLIYNGEIRP